MKLTKINYGSAVFFGILAFISMFLLGLVGMFIPEIAVLMGAVGTLSFKDTIVAALTQGVSGYVGVIFTILIYNLVAKKYPISWETKK